MCCNVKNCEVLQCEFNLHESQDKCDFNVDACSLSFMHRYAVRHARHAWTLASRHRRASVRQIPPSFNWRVRPKDGNDIFWANLVPCPWFHSRMLFAHL
jgi:hypothetical protein